MSNQPEDVELKAAVERTKQDWVELLFEVQAGSRSCRNMADLILAATSPALEAVARERDIALQLHQDALRLIGADVTEAYEIGRGLRPSPFESGWLIEAWDSKRGQFKAEWWTLFCDENGDWTKDSTKALRFSREIDAQAYIDDVGWTEAKPTEHGWGKPLAAMSPALEARTEVDERVVAFFDKAGIGMGDDPVGFLLASHALLVHQRKEAEARVKALEGEARHIIETEDQFSMAWACERLRAALSVQGVERG